MNKAIIAGGVIVAGLTFWTLSSLSSGEESPVFSEPAPIAVTEDDIRAQITAPKPVRKVENSQAEKALMALNLWEAGEDSRWDDRYGKDGTYVFTNLDFKMDNNTAFANELELSGVRLVGEVPYFDSLKASGLVISPPKNEKKEESDDFGEGWVMYPPLSTSGRSERKTYSAENVTVNMPSAEELGGWLTLLDADDIDHPLSFLELMADEPFKIQALPEVIAENYVMTTQKRIRDNGPLSDGILALPVTPSGNRPKPTYKEVEIKTRFDFAGLSKLRGTDQYQLQVNNFSTEDYNYQGNKETGQFASLSLSGFEAQGIESLNPDLAEDLIMPSKNIYDPYFQSFSMQGFSMDENDAVIRIDQASVWYSDTKADQYSLNIDVPRIDISENTMIENKRRYGGNPFKEIGYDNAQLSFSWRMNFDRAAKSVELQQAKFNLFDGFEGSLSYSLKNWEGMSHIYSAPLEDGSGNSTVDDYPSIAHGEIQFTDRGILDRVHESMAAEKDGMDLEAAKNVSKGALGFATAAGRTEYQQTLLKSLADSYASLIDNGGTFTASMRPQRPVYMERFSKISQLLMGSGFRGRESENQDEVNREMDELLQSANYR